MKASVMTVGALSDAPSDLGQLTAQWLTAALCGEVPLAQVLSFRVLPEQFDCCFTKRVGLEYNAIGQGAGLPEVIEVNFVRGQVAGMVRQLREECRFYGTLRNRVVMNAPHVYFAASDPRGDASICVVEDVRSTRGAQFCGAAKVDYATADSMLSNLAAYHGTFWNSELLAGLRPPPTSPSPHRLGRWRLQPFGCDAEHSRGLGQAPVTLIHGDPHRGNWYRDDAGEMGLAHWGTAAVGSWAHDVSRTMASILTEKQLRRWGGGSPDVLSPETRRERRPASGVR